jgi:hypothetical protein
MIIGPAGMPNADLNSDATRSLFDLSAGQKKLLEWMTRSASVAWGFTTI